MLPGAPTVSCFTPMHLYMYPLVKYILLNKQPFQCQSHSHLISLYIITLSAYYESKLKTNYLKYLKFATD